MTIIFIALLQAVPVFMIAAWTKSRIALTTAAIVAGYIGVVTGSPAYMAVDLIGVCLAFWLGMYLIKDQKPYIAPQTEKPSQTLQNKKDDSFWGGIVGLIIVGVFLYNKTSDKPAISSPPAVAQVTQQTNILQKSTRPIGLKQQVKPKKSATVSGSRANSNSSHCFNLPTDAEILQCLN